MPESPASLEQRVADAVEQRRQELERLVDQELDRTVAMLVAERLAARNGAAATLNGDRALTRVNASTKRCKTCGREKSLGEFERNRGTCKACRHEYARARKHAAAQAPPEAGPPDPFRVAADEPARI